MHFFFLSENVSKKEAALDTSLFYKKKIPDDKILHDYLRRRVSFLSSRPFLQFEILRILWRPLMKIYLQHHYYFQLPSEAVNKKIRE